MWDIKVRRRGKKGKIAGSKIACAVNAFAAVENELVFGN